MHCELCGKLTELFTAMVEGAQMQVCANCGRFGKVLRKAAPPRTAAPVRKAASEPVQVERVIEGYGDRVRGAREKRGLTQQDFAKLLTVKESLVHKMETGHFEPDIELARRLEKLLHVTLVEVRIEGGIVDKPQDDERPACMTIGDILNMKRR